MFNRKKTRNIAAFMEGKLIQLESVNDPVFSKKMMGDGFAIEPTNGSVVSPVDGEITMIFPTNHAVGIKTKDNIEVLLHIGIDTVQLKGSGFEVFVQEGDKVKTGDMILSVDLDNVISQSKETTSMLILTGGQTLKDFKEKDVVLGEEKVVSLA